MSWAFQRTRLFAAASSLALGVSRVLRNLGSGSVRSAALFCLLEFDLTQSAKAVPFTRLFNPEASSLSLKT